MSLQRTGYVISAAGALVAVIAPLTAQSAAVQATGLAAGLAAFCFGLMVSRHMTGRFKLGPFEGDLREQVRDALEEEGRREGVDPEQLEQLVAKVDEKLNALHTPGANPERIQPSFFELSQLGIECANCHTLMPHESAARFSYGHADCPQCGSRARRILRG